jgi:uncharacterized membrane protein SpoIIM required for sporulation/dipeptidyl aminopeptidase/acylaminoacyl peptidase
VAEGHGDSQQLVIGLGMALSRATFCGFCKICSVLWKLRWALGAVLTVSATGCVHGYLRAQTQPVAESAQVARDLLHGSPSSWLYPWCSPDPWGHTLLRFFGPNVLRVLFVFFWGTLSLGLVAVRAAWLNGSLVGLVIGGSVPLAYQAAGTGVLGTAAGCLLPHGLPEYASFVVVWALSLRSGIRLLRPPRGMNRASAFAEAGRDYGITLVAVIPLLFLAAVIEQYVNPLFVDTWVIGVDRQTSMIQEDRVGAHFAAGTSSFGPAEDRLACADASGSRLCIRSPEGELFRQLRTEAMGAGLVASLTWSPSGQQCALAIYDFSQAASGQLLLVDVRSGGWRPVANGPPGRYLSASWSPVKEGCIAIAVSAADTRSIGLWMVDPRNDEWRVIPSLAGASELSLAAGNGLAWSPDGSRIAFVARWEGHRAHGGTGSAEAGYIVCIARADGSRVQRVTHIPNNTALAWSPDGRWIAFVDGSMLAEANDERHAGTQSTPLVGRVCLVNPDGNGRIDDVSRADITSSLSWSADGTKIAYQRLGTCIIGGVDTVLSAPRSASSYTQSAW